MNDVFGVIRMLRLEDSVKKIKGVGEKTAALFEKIHIETIEDLLLYLPRGFETYDAPKSPMEEENGKLVSIPANLISGSMVSKKAGRYFITTAKVRSGEKQVLLRFFNMPYLKNVLQPCENYVLRGTLTVKRDRVTGEASYSMLQPKIYEIQKYQEFMGHLSPLYPLTKGLTNKTIQKAIEKAVLDLEEINDYLDVQTCQSMKLISLMDAICSIHLPKTEFDYENGRKRLAFHEFLMFLYQMQENKKDVEQELIKSPLLPTAETNRLIEKLPYELTQDQKTVWHEIENDMEQVRPMNRLLQGDVGSGKTIMAFLALLKACANGKQGCLMAPTEVLAQQHYQGLKELCKEYQLNMQPVLLLGSMTAKEKREAREGIASGYYNAIIGTHAVMQTSVEYKDLAIVITDEQHRFGVNQREALRKKGEQVHVLVMSATPIPRTLALILYGDLSISTIKQLPSNRLPIKNCVVDDGYREKAYSFMQKEIASGRQVYIICPMVQLSEATDELENVIDYTEKIRERFSSEIVISYLHGKMTMKEKETIMDAFAKQEIDILVSTTVIEVGINVPNATVIMVENSERYGLAQLHQLRGRVGRGEHQSYCIFMSGNASKKNKERLEILNHSNDGFEIANKDLELRGPGQLGGIRQSGELGFSVADIYEDQDMLVLANQYLQEVFRTNDIEQIEELSQKLSHFQMMTDKIKTL